MGKREGRNFLTTSLTVGYYKLTWRFVKTNTSSNYVLCTLSLWHISRQNPLKHQEKSTVHGKRQYFLVTTIHTRLYPSVFSNDGQQQSYESRGVRKTEILFGFGYKKNPNRIRTVQKFDIRADGFSTMTACNVEFKLEVTIITLLAFSVQIKKVLKHDRNRVCI